MSILIEIKNVYGNETIYPVCEIAITLAALTGKKTFNKNDIKLIRSLGYEINIKSQTI